MKKIAGTLMASRASKQEMTTSPRFSKTRNGEPERKEEESTKDGKQWKE
jgi:hypothetical protein